MEAPRSLQSRSNLFMAGNAIPLYGCWALKCPLCGSGRTTAVCLARVSPVGGQRDPFLWQWQRYSHFVGNIISRCNLPSAEHVRVLSFSFSFGSLLARWIKAVAEVQRFSHARMHICGSRSIAIIKFLSTST